MRISRLWELDQKCTQEKLIFKSRNSLEKSANELIQFVGDITRIRLGGKRRANLVAEFGNAR